MSAKNVFDTMRSRSGPWKIGSGQGGGHGKLSILSVPFKSAMDF